MSNIIPTAVPEALVGLAASTNKAASLASPLHNNGATSGTNSSMEQQLASLRLLAMGSSGSGDHINGQRSPRTLHSIKPPAGLRDYMRRLPLSEGELELLALMYAVAGRPPPLLVRIGSGAAYADSAAAATAAAAAASAAGAAGAGGRSRRAGVALEVTHL